LPKRFARIQFFTGSFEKGLDELGYIVDTIEVTSFTCSDMFNHSSPLWKRSFDLTPFQPNSEDECFGVYMKEIHVTPELVLISFSKNEEPGQ
jgi:hypothetical protein